MIESLHDYEPLFGFALFLIFFVFCFVYFLFAYVSMSITLSGYQDHSKFERN